MTIFKLPGDLKSASAPTGTFEALPVGEYPVEVVNADVKPTQTKGRSQIVLQLRIIDGDYKNRQVWDRWSLPIPEDGGPESFIYQRLKELCDAVPGAFDLDRGAGDTDAFKGAQFMIKTTNKKDTRPGFEDQWQTRVQRVYLPQDDAEVQEMMDAPAEAAPAAPPPAKKRVLAAPAPTKVPDEEPEAAAEEAAPATPPPAAPVRRSVFRRPSAN